MCCMGIEHFGLMQTTWAGGVLIMLAAIFNVSCVQNKFEYWSFFNLNSQVKSIVFFGINVVTPFI